ncbi:hypothetical protein DFQ26_007435 [Actinomortierella ambigua]|nr:hypothetical protein DFQ26_007435 [Actinomortierella ambigua]
MPSTCLLSLSALAAIIGIAVYLPLQRTEKLLQGPAVIENFGLEKCQRIAGPAFCEDVKIQRNLGLGFVACDPSMPFRNYAASVVDQSKMTEDGGIWVYDMNKPGSEATKLELRNFEGPFHPSGLTFAPVPAEDTPARVVVLAINHVPFEQPRVEVFHYSPARKTMTHKKTIHSKAFVTANKITASHDEYSHQIDDTPSFFVTNDHGFNITNWKREYEEKYNLPASTLAYYNARANEAVEVGWRFQLPNAIVPASDEGTFWIAAGKSGTIERYRNHLISEEHQAQQVIAIDTKTPLSIKWPGMLNDEIIQTNLINIGVDYDPLSDNLVSVAHSRWNDYVQHAKDRHDHPDKKPSVHSGFIVTKAVKYPVRIGTARAQPEKDVVYNPDEMPRKYRLKYFFEPQISHEGDQFGAVSSIAVMGDRVLLTGQYDEGILDCQL